MIRRYQWAPWAVFFVFSVLGFKKCAEWHDAVARDAALRKDKDNAASDTSKAYTAERQSRCVG